MVLIIFHTAEGGTRIVYVDLAGKLKTATFLGRLNRLDVLRLWSMGRFD
jgi:hypothetical protein